MPKTSVRERLTKKVAQKGEEKAATQSTKFTLQLQELLNLENSGNFIAATRQIIEKVNQMTEFETGDVILLENIYDKYIAVLKPETITREDIDTLSICFSKILNTIKRDGMITRGIVKNPEKFIALINEAEKFALNIELQNNKGEFRNHQYCEDILIAIENNFPFEKKTIDELDYKLQASVGQGLLRFSLNIYKKMQEYPNFKKAPSESKMFIAACISSKQQGNFANLQKVIKTFNINLKHLKIHFKDDTFSPMNFITMQHDALKEKYIKLLMELGLRPDDEKDRPDFQDFFNLSPLMIACGKGDFISSKLLIEHGADINLATILEHTQHTLMYRTPFAMAISSTNQKLVEYLLQSGADPMKAGRMTKKYHEERSGNKLPANILLFPTFIINDAMSLEKDLDYFDKVCNLIAQHYINKILLSIEPSKLTLTDDQAEKSAVIEAKTTAKLLDDYTNFKKDPLVQQQEIQTNGKLSLESRFDLLILEFFKDSSTKNFNIISNFIEQNPELNLYDASGIFANNNYEEAKEILADKRKIIKKFFESKKDYPTIDIKAQETDEIDNVFQIKSTRLKNKIYVSVHPKLKSDPRYLEIEGKITNALENAQFISSNSKNISGIKAYNGTIKLKICGKNLYLYAHDKYQEDTTGNILIVLNNIGDHKQVDHDAKLHNELTIKKVSKLKTTWQEIQDSFSYSECETEENNSETVTPYDDQEQINNFPALEQLQELMGDLE